LSKITKSFFFSTLLSLWRRRCGERWILKSWGLCLSPWEIMGGIVGLSPGVKQLVVMMMRSYQCTQPRTRTDHKIEVIDIACLFSGHDTMIKRMWSDRGEEALTAVADGWTLEH